MHFMVKSGKPLKKLSHLKFYPKKMISGLVRCMFKISDDLYEADENIDKMIK